MKVLKVILISFLAVLLLNGCVQYEVGINFESQNHGEIVQHIKLADELNNFSGTIVSEWLKSIETRVGKLQGKTKKISSQEILVTIPFNNGAELEEKFNQFFKPIDAQESDNSAADITADLPKLESHIEVSQNNLFLALRNKLSIDLDLQLSTSNSKVIVNPDELLDLEFQLTTPWGFSNIQATENETITYLNDQEIVWKLNPGESNSLDVVFWIPSPIGIGTILIGLFVYLGIALKYQVLPALGIINK
ncbi:DUF3153 domain-containing protein [Okeania sp. SIO2B3]|uniref:DUF3153 domain-containing protein n=1 Tax=Okeania sp. SIO2B3 TaxID=2607784 RepID=UPI0013BF7297|nr:DUF3153 domain-containing protein [Okeania sp. SIO2B3]NET46930.1 DUF3153 domain-containing protein [Okeania sp. SIO2B3]